MYGQFRVNINVQDASRKTPIEFASVLVNNQGNVTDSLGLTQVVVDHLSLSIKVTAVGYEDLITAIDLNDQTVQNVLVLVLNPANHYLSEVSIVSSRYERSLINEVSSVEIVKPDLLQSNNNTTLDKFLDLVPGVQMIGGQANIRGGAGYSYGAGSRVLLTVDDVPAMQSDAGYPNWGDIPIENMARVEILKGAGSVLYGSSAMNGVFNFRTAWPDAEPETKVTTQWVGYLSPKDKEKKWWSAMPFESNTNVLHKQKFDKLQAVFGANYYHLNSFLKERKDRSVRLFANTRYQLTDHLYLTLNGLLNSGQSNDYTYWVDGKMNAYVGDTSSSMETKKLRFYIDPVLTWQKGNYAHKLIGRYYSVNNESIRNQSAFSDMRYLEYRFQNQFQRIGMSITAGALYTGTSVDAALYGDTTYISTNLASYVSIDQLLFKKLTLNVGARYEYNLLKSPEIVDGTHIPEGKTSESKPVFKSGVNYLLTRFTSLRASWGQGYRYPTIAEKFIQTNAGIIQVSPNPTLQSETGWSAEIGVKQGLKIGKWVGLIDAAYFWSEYDNMMEFALLSIAKGFQSHNIGDTKITGYEANIQGESKSGNFRVRTMAGYTYINPVYRNFEEIDTLKSTVGYNVLKYRMKHALRGDLSLFWKNLEVGASYIYNSHMLAIDKIFDVAISGVHDFREAHPNGFSVLNLRVIYPVIEHHLTIGIHLNNALNAEYMYRPGFLEAPRSVGVRIEYKI